MAVAPGDRGVAVAGDVTNSVIVTGDNVTLNVRLDAAEGALLDRLAQAQGFAALPLPLDSRPRRYPNHVDREEEARSLLAAAGQSGAACVYGEPGIGKSHLLAHAAHLPEAAAQPDGIAYVPADGAPFDDVLQVLFEEFYDPGSPPHRPSRSRLRRELRERQALVVVDGLELEAEEARAVVETAPGCRFLVAATERRLWDAAPLRLEGLRLADALQLVEQELARPLTAEERPDAERLCEALGGHPWRVREAVARARDEGRSLAEAARALGPTDMLDALTEGERSVLAGLAAAGGGPVGLAHVRELAATEDVDSVLAGLERRHLVHSHSPRYSLAEPMLGEIEARWDLDARRESALDHFAGWCERHRGEPQVAEEQPAVLGLLRWAASTGRDEEAIRLGRAADPALAVSGQFGSWAETVDVVLGAARRRRDPAVEAWALHQRGTWAACLVGGEVALPDLEAARALRREIGDRSGEAATEHNIGIVRSIVGGGGTGGHGAAFFVTMALLGALVVALAVVGGLFAYDRLADDGTATESTVPLVKVPRVVGDQLGDAESELKDAGLTPVEAAGREFSDAPRNEVLSQDPEEDEEVEPGTIVTLVVSAGPQPPTTTEEPPLPEIDLTVQITDTTQSCADVDSTCTTVFFTVSTVDGSDLPATFDAVAMVDPEGVEPVEQSLSTANGPSFGVPVPLVGPCNARCTYTVTVAPDGTFTDPDLDNNVATQLPPVIE